MLLINYHPSFYSAASSIYSHRRPLTGGGASITLITPLNTKSIEETSIQVDVGESSRVVWPAVLASGSVSSLKSRLIVIKVVEEFHEYFFFFFCLSLNGLI